MRSVRVRSGKFKPFGPAPRCCKDAVGALLSKVSQAKGCLDEKARSPLTRSPQPPRRAETVSNGGWPRQPRLGAASAPPSSVQFPEENGDPLCG